MPVMRDGKLLRRLDFGLRLFFDAALLNGHALFQRGAGGVAAAGRRPRGAIGRKFRLQLLDLGRRSRFCLLHS